MRGLAWAMMAAGDRSVYRDSAWCRATARRLIKGMTMKSAWYKDAVEDAVVDHVTRASLDRVLDRRSAEVRERIARERKVAKERSQPVVKLSKMHSVSHYAEMLGFSDETIRCWIKAGELKAVYIGGAYRITESDMKAFIEKECLKRG